MDRKKRGCVSPELAQVVLDRADGRCEICGNYETQPYPKRHEIHHIIGRMVDASPENLIFLCYNCHKGKGSVHDKPNSGKDLELKLKLQNKYLYAGLDESEVRQLMGGKLYLDNLLF